jgi:septal ring factor EnvC (AmiA/AmiB activator)
MSESDLNSGVNQGEATSRPGYRDPTLGSSVSADLEALKNDVEQAKELASDYQRQLAGKSNDLATMKQLFEKTRSDLVHLHEGITRLREERHQLANDAMRAEALALKVERLTRERDCLQNEVQALRNSRASETDERVLQLTRELARLKGEGKPNDLRGRPSGPARSYNSAASIEVPFGDSEDDLKVTIVPTEQIAARRRR